MSIQPGKQSCHQRQAKIPKRPMQVVLFGSDRRKPLCGSLAFIFRNMVYHQTYARITLIHIFSCEFRSCITVESHVGMQVKKTKQTNYALQSNFTISSLERELQETLSFIAYILETSYEDNSCR